METDAGVDVGGAALDGGAELVVELVAPELDWAAVACDVELHPETEAAMAQMAHTAPTPVIRRPDRSGQQSRKQARKRRTVPVAH